MQTNGTTYGFEFNEISETIARAAAAAGAVTRDENRMTVSVKETSQMTYRLLSYLAMSQTPLVSA